MENQNINPTEYTSWQPQKNTAKNNAYAVISLIAGIISFVFVCFPPLQLIFGGLSVMFAALSKQSDKYERTAIIGFIIGISSCLISFFIFWLFLNTMELLKQDPVYLNKLIKMTEEMLGITY